MSLSRFGLCLLLVSTALALPRVGRAHDESVSASDVVVMDREVRWTVDVGLVGLAKVVDFPEAPGGDPEALPESAILGLRTAIADYLRGGIAVSLDGRPIPAQVGALEPRYETVPPSGTRKITRVALELRFLAPAAIRQLHARVGFFSDLTSSHRALLKIRWGDQSRQMTALGVAEVALERGRLNPSRWVVAWDFVRWGAHHIFIGYDHIAFLLALLLAVARLRSLLLIITSFTVAHSLTILLAALDVVHMPTRLTEALIAASIVWVALENLALGVRPRPRRWALTFGFGLIHGLGFAEVLRDRLAEAPGGILLPVIAFNVGVELGQAVLVAAAFPLLIWWRRGAGGVLPPQSARIREERILRFGSIPIALLGMFWLVQRLL
jgi:hydrogenase/urease accessory protein HupE